MVVESIQFSIENNFWSTDKAALNILLDKLNQSNKTTLAIKDYFNQRAQVEEEYGNQLLKLAELFENNIQQEDNFNIISNTTEMSARAHIDLSQNIKNLLELPLNNFINETDNIKSYMTNQMKESQNMKLLHDGNVKKTRCTYVNECQKANSSNKDIEILEFEYQQAINLMQLNSPAWLHDWRESCKTFGSLESNRLDYLKAVIKTFSSMIASTYSIDDQTCDRLLSAMDDIDTNEEIKKFIVNYGTGSTIPEIPKYTKFKRESRVLEVNNKIHDLHLQPKKLRIIKEIVIPNNHDEQLRSVNDQLKKIPSPWYNKENSTTPKIEINNSDSDQATIFPPQQYPLNPIYKSTKKVPSKSDPILSSSSSNNFNFQQDKKNKSTLVTPYEEESYQQKQIHPHDTYNKDTSPPWNTNKTKNDAETGHNPTKIKLSSSSTNKKPSLFLAPLNFLKKKKIESNNRDSNKKRLSLGCISTTTTTTTAKNNSNQHNMPLSPTSNQYHHNKRNSSSTVLTPSSPMFSQIDFYYTPSNNSDVNHHNILTSPPPPTFFP